MILRSDYRAHEGFIAPALERSELWRVVLGVVVCAISYLAFSLAYFQIIYGLAGRNAIALFEGLNTTSAPFPMLLLLFSFAPMILSVFFCLRLLHNRPFASLLGPRLVFWRDFCRVLIALIFLLSVVVILPPWNMGEPYQQNLALRQWLTLLPISLLGVFVQVSAEEILFRGYLQQQLAARFRAPWVWMLLPSALFAVGHYSPETTGSNAVFIALWAGVFGLLMADLTARSGSLGPAIAIHLCNNVFAMLVFSWPDELSGLALYHLPFSLADTDRVRDWLPVDMAFMIICWLAARLALRR
ncbi:MAG: CPBP family intramembrane glutamic endopeptidase [Pseudomonadota bacterium]